MKQGIQRGNWGRCSLFLAHKYNNKKKCLMKFGMGVSLQKLTKQSHCFILFQRVKEPDSNHIVEAKLHAKERRYLDNKACQCQLGLGS